MPRYRAALLLTGLLLPSIAAASDYAPLDCSKSRSAAEKTICKSYDLGQSEARMATLYAVATSLVGMGQRGALQDQQRAWIKTREGCGDRVGCLGYAYATRIHALSGVIDSVAAHGPF